ncbi:MAG TPA: NAD(P)H-dependent oxidoreductase [Candidatus Cryosericum sp.]|nr:NAD(P)H-dependent oxidoreductase [Candidatus Cryosericum sp.]
MSQPTMKLTIINGSPKANSNPSVSDYLSALAETQIQNGAFRIERFSARKSVLAGSTDAFSAMAESDAILLVFPLYFFCLPGILTRFLQDYASFVKAQPQSGKIVRVYAVVNCGFPEDEINSDALRVVESFSSAIGARYRFGLMIGGGGMLLGAKDAPFMKEFKNTINGFLSDVQNDIIVPSDARHETMRAFVKFPRKLYFMMGNFGWTMQAKQNGLKPRDLKKKPYRV